MAKKTTKVKKDFDKFINMISGNEDWDEPENFDPLDEEIEVIYSDSEDEVQEEAPKNKINDFSLIKEGTTLKMGKGNVEIYTREEDPRKTGIDLPSYELDEKTGMSDTKTVINKLKKMRVKENLIKNGKIIKTTKKPRKTSRKRCGNFDD